MTVVPRFCRVAATLKRVPDSDIIEIGPAYAGPAL